MRIVHLGVASDVPLLHRGGGAVQRRIWEMARVQASRGHDILVYSFGDEDEVREREGVEVRFLRCRSSHPIRQLEFQARALRDLEARHGRVDLLHAHGQPEAALLGRRLAGRVALSYDNFFFRGGHRGALGWFYRAALGAFDLLLPCSEYCRAESAAHWRLDPSRLPVLYNGVNLQQFQPDPAAGRAEREALGLAGPVVLYVGRVCEQKGTRLLVEAWPQVAAGARGTLVIAGPVERFGTTDDGTWAERIRRVGGVYLGAVDEARLARVYNMASLFVMPTVELEMFGMAAVEAQACGVPVLASDLGGLRETVPDDVGGRFRVGDPRDLAVRLLELLRDGERLRACSASARRSASRYSWETICARVEDLVSSAPPRDGGRAARERQDLKVRRPWTS